jgi:hypothetical protein
LPGHPLYGQKVQLSQYGSAAHAHYCLIEDPSYPDFHYQIKATWLSSTPPLPVSTNTFQQKSIWIDLSALDKMINMILIHSNYRRASEDEQPVKRKHPPNSKSTTETEPPNAPRTSLLSGITTDRRNSS